MRKPLPYFVALMGLMLALFAGGLPESGRALSASPTETPTRPDDDGIASLVSDKYLHDTSLVDKEPCGPPCFAGITVGKTLFEDALEILRANPAFSDVHREDESSFFAVSWASAEGVTCCQMTADLGTQIVDAMLLRLAPGATLGELIAAHGEPAYVSVLEEDYSPEETAMGLVYPEIGTVAWVMVGKPDGAVEADDPIVIVLYFDPARFDPLLESATLVPWTGYGPYQDYRLAEPVITPLPMPTATLGSLKP